MRHKPKTKARYGLTISEVLIASMLLIAVMVPILKALTSSQAAATNIEHKTHSLMLAEAKIEDIRSRAIYNYSHSYSANSLALEGSYLCSISDTVISSNLRQITVLAGYDDNGNKTLNDSEKLVTLTTLVAKRW